MGRNERRCEDVEMGEGELGGNKRADCSETQEERRGVGRKEGANNNNNAGRNGVIFCPTV